MLHLEVAPKVAPKVAPPSAPSRVNKWRCVDPPCNLDVELRCIVGGCVTVCEVFFFSFHCCLIYFDQTINSNLLIVRNIKVILLTELLPRSICF